MRSAPALFVLSALFAVVFGQNSADLFEGYKRDAFTNPRNSLAHFRMGEIYFSKGNYQSAANEFRSALNGDLNPKWVEVWSLINLGKIFDQTHQCDHAVNQYWLAMQTNYDEGGALEEANQYLNANSIRKFVYHPETAADLNRTVNLIRREFIQKTEPAYSDEARLAGIEGSVLVAGLVAEDGSTHGLRVVRPLGLGLDEKAIETVRQWRLSPLAGRGPQEDVISSWEIDFRLPSKRSPWHLIRAEFHPPEGASRPVFSIVNYPHGAGIGPAAMEEARVISATGRFSAAKVSLDIDERGNPVNFQVENASEELWGVEAIHLISGWRFIPAMRAGNPVPSRCTMEVAWGLRNLSASTLSQLHIVLNAAQPPSVPATCRSVQH
jgi:TonB family protein